MNSILQYLDELVPEHLRSNPSDLMRAYILLGVILSNFIISILVIGIIVFFIDLPPEQNLLAIGLDGACTVTYIVAFYIFRRTSNHQLTSHLTIMCLALVLCIGIQITGGFSESPVLKLSIQIPVTAFLLSGLLGGSIWLAITVGLCFLSFLGHVYDVGQAQLLTNANDIQAFDFSLTFITLLLVGGALIIYELINENLKQKLNEERNRFEHKASHDSLTGLPNRFEFFRRLRTGIVESSDREQKLGLAYLDLDGFKPINDQYGHHAGDEILKTIAKRVQQVLRLSDTTARLGGDEFALILPGIRVPDDLDIVMPKVLDAISQPIDIGDTMVSVQGSIGVALYPDHSEDIDRLCRFSDAAMYQAKEQNSTWVFYQREYGEGDMPNSWRDRPEIR